MIAPPEGTGEGSVFVDLWIPTWASGELPYELEAADGRLVSCPQDTGLVDKFNAVPGRNVLAEIGLGTNQAARRDSRCGMEVEKAIGTAHVAFGSNVDFGGANQSDVHMDFMFDKVTLKLGDRIIIDNGTPCFGE